MKKFTKICLVFIAVLVILGISMCAAGVVMGAGSQNLREVWNDGNLARLARWNWNWDNDWDDTIWKNSKETRHTYSADGIRNIYISLRHGGLEIEESTDSQITVILERDDGLFAVSEKDGTLRLEDQRTGNRARYDYEVTVKLPRGMTLDQVEIENNAGLLEWDDIALTAKHVSVKVDAGEVSIENLTTEDFRVEVGAGQASISGLEADRIDTDCGVGQIDLEIRGRESDYNYRINCGLGNIEVNERDYTSLGRELHVDNHAEKEILLNCGVGEIVLETIGR